MRPAAYNDVDLGPIPRTPRTAMVPVMAYDPACKLLFSQTRPVGLLAAKLGQVRIALRTGTHTVTVCNGLSVADEEESGLTGFVDHRDTAPSSASRRPVEPGPRSMIRPSRIQSIAPQSRRDVGAAQDREVEQ